MARNILGMEFVLCLQRPDTCQFLAAESLSSRPHQARCSSLSHTRFACPDCPIDCMAGYFRMLWSCPLRLHAPCHCRWMGCLEHCIAWPLAKRTAWLAICTQQCVVLRNSLRCIRLYFVNSIVSMVYCSDACACRLTVSAAYSSSKSSSVSEPKHSSMAILMTW